MNKIEPNYVNINYIQKINDPEIERKIYIKLICIIYINTINID